MTWHPIASSADLAYRTTYHAQILGRELVAWRADDDTVNLWENRCLHRGLRLTLGTNDGAELVCRYHGWRYANRTAGCTYIPAHPADAPPRTICNRIYPVAERYGLVWGSADVDTESDPPVVDLLETSPLLVLRAVGVNAPPARVADVLADYRFRPSPTAAAAGDDGHSYCFDESDGDVRRTADPASGASSGRGRAGDDDPCGGAPPRCELAVSERSGEGLVGARRGASPQPPLPGASRR